MTARENTPDSSPFGIDKPIGERTPMDVAAEESYWRDAYTRERHYDPSYRYDDYAPGYRTGYEGAARYAGQSFESAEPHLRDDYARLRGPSALDWEDARPSALSAWNRIATAADPGIVSNPPSTR